MTPKDGSFDTRLPPVRCDHELVEIIRRAADADRRTVSQWVRIAVEREAKRQLRERGML